MMDKRFCTSCGQNTWHNATTTKYSGWRCTYCGHPVGGSLEKKAAAELTRRKQAIKAGSNI